MPEPETRFTRLSAGICRRAFSSPEALAYEVGIAPAVCTIVTGLVAEHLTGVSVLDVGCGGGRLARELVQTRGGHFVGVDPSAAQMRRVARHSSDPRSVSGVRAVADHLPFACSSFDAVVSSCALKHWPDPRLGLEECVRVARGGGSVVVVEIDGDANSDAVRQFAGSTRVPPGLRAAYTRFAMRTVVGVALRADRVGELMAAAGVVSPSVRSVEGLPFLVAHGRVA